MHLRTENRVRIRVEVKGEYENSLLSRVSETPAIQHSQRTKDPMPHESKSSLQKHTHSRVSGGP
jgi:hypothetical protein